MEIAQKIEIEVPHNPTIPFLGRYVNKTKTLIWKDTYTPMFIAALFPIAKIWQLPKCPSNSEWIRRCCVYSHTHTHNGLLLNHKKEWIVAICSNMGGLEDHYAKWNVRKKQKLYDVTYVWNLKSTQI